MSALITLQPGGTLTSYIVSARGDLAGLAQIRLDDSTGATWYGPTLVGLTLMESPTVQYLYKVSIAVAPNPLPDGIYALIVQIPANPAASVDAVQVTQDALSPGTSDEPAICSLWCDPIAVKAGVSPTPSDADAASAAVEATSILYELSGQVWPGVCTVTVKLDPSMRWFPLAGDLWWMRFNAAFDMAAMWWNADRIFLTGWPVNSILEVKNPDGSVVDASIYELRNAYLWNIGSGAWVPGTTVTYSVGASPPIAGANAALALAENLLGSAAKCVLPANTVSASRQGVSVTKQQASVLRDLGLTGLDAVDRFLRVFNPNGLRMQPQVWSPDVDVPRRLG